MWRATMFAVVSGLLLVPSSVGAQQASVQARAQVISRIEMQMVVQPVETGEAAVVGGGSGVPASWRWEVRAGVAGEPAASLAATPLAAGRGGDPSSPLRYSMDQGAMQLSYLYAPI